MDLRFELDDLTRPAVIAMLEEHLADMYAVSPPESSSSDGNGSPSKRTSPYGSSSRTSRSCSRASSTMRARRSSLSVRPLGFWKVGIR